ncbi:MAG: beta-mannanase [Bacillus sp. (in: Bacteria)]|nr:beta-mannanase [Bacillus sp. (in: firmicutes)]
MNWEPIPSPNHEITAVKKMIRDSEVHLTWFWAKEIDFVYIYKASANNTRSSSELGFDDLLLYTREEYKVNQGFKGRLETIGRYSYRIFPCQKRDGKPIIFRQENENNLIYISGLKAKIYFSIIYKTKLLQKKKKVKMSIMTELPLAKEQLVYVRKKGSVPISITDGTVYPFIRDFPPGKMPLPEIEIDKNDYIRIFFSNGKAAAQDFELIPE